MKKYCLIFVLLLLLAVNTQELQSTLQLEQTPLDLQSKFQAQEQKYAAVLANILSKLTSTTDELSSMKNNFPVLRNEYESLQIEVAKLSSNLTSAAQSTLTSLQASLISDVRDIRHEVSQLKGSIVDTDSACSSNLINETNASISGCLPGFINHGSSCYMFSKDNATYIEALVLCRYISSRLAVITTKEEDDYVRGHLLQLHDGKAYYIDGSDFLQEGTWTWDCLRNMTYTNWAPSQPDSYGGSENCMVLYPHYSYKWNDQDCNVQGHYICEKMSK